MMRAFLFALFVLFCTATLEEDWKNAVEEILAHVTLGPLKMDFTPDYVANRTMEFVLRKQTNRFRAMVASAIVECNTEEARACVPHSIDSTVVKAILEELKERSFEAFWLHEMDECAGKSGLLIKVPPPKK